LVSEAKVRHYEPPDASAVLALSEKYASWDATPTLADIQGFHSQNPDLFFVAEVDDKIVGFVYGRESNPPQPRPCYSGKQTGPGSSKA
jgi:ribosomal protein S18 acetylase RimI-like enzyme